MSPISKGTVVFERRKSRSMTFIGIMCVDQKEICEIGR